MEYMLHRLVAVLALIFYTQGAIYSNLWAVQIKGGERKARSVAEQSGFTFVEKIMDDFYHLTHHQVKKRSLGKSEEHHEMLSSHPEVLWLAQQEIKHRVKRDLSFNDEKFRQQWYLHSPTNKRSSSIGMNVQGAWSRGYTGKGVVVTILDDGIERTHPDLRMNYDPEASWDINSQDSDPLPRYDYTNENRHGTRCAGEVAAAANNSYCGVGVAYEASIGGIRMLDGDVTDSVEAMSLSLNRNHIDIYSASWGPDDDGKTVDGPNVLARRAFRDGVLYGRNGKGSIFVWASGNGGRDYDNCNCDGYTNSIYTLSVSSATENGNVPWYSEACSSTLVSTYSSGDHREKQITTTDLRRGCTSLHTGTSASAPLAAGIVALALQANHNLTWRDVQYISVLAAAPDGLEADDWVVNGAGYKVSHHFGFGLMNAEKMVDLAVNWTTLPEQRMCEVVSMDRNIMIPAQETVKLELTTTGCRGSDKEINFLEHVQAKISLASSWRGDLQIWLTSPSGTRSNLLTRRVNDNSQMGFGEWAFLTTHNWGEASQGKWVLEISNGYRAAKPATLREWTLILYGTEKDPVKREVTPAPSTPSIKDTLAEVGIILPEHPDFSGPATDVTSSIRSETTITSSSTHSWYPGTDSVNHIPTGDADDDDYVPIWDIPAFVSKSSVKPISNSINSAQDVKCPENMYYLKDKCLESCLDGYYPDSSPSSGLRCLPCHYTCDACSGASNSACTKCFHGSKLENGQCVLIASSHQIKTGAASQNNDGLSADNLRTIIFAATSTLGVLVLILISLVIYYIYHQHKTKRRKNSTNDKSLAVRDAKYTVVNHEHLSGSKHSSQQELMDDIETSSEGKLSSSSIEYRYHPNVIGQQV